MRTPLDNADNLWRLRVEWSNVIIFLTSVQSYADLKRTLRDTPNSVIAVTIAPDITTPTIIIGMDLTGLMPNVQAAKHPDHAPVNGSGMATKGTKINLP